MFRRGGRGGGRGRLGSNRGGGVRIKFNNSNKRNKIQELNFFSHGTGPDIQTAKFTKLNQNQVLNIQSEFVNGSNIVESIHKKEILYFSKEIT